MTEAQLTYRLTRMLRLRLPQATVFKHADGFTAGMPDVSISWEGHTVWVEVKLLNNKKLFEPLQLETLRRLRGWYLVWDTKVREGYFFKPNEPMGQSLPLYQLCERICKEVV